MSTKNLAKPAAKSPSRTKKPTKVMRPSKPPIRAAKKSARPGPAQTNSKTSPTPAASKQNSLIALLRAPAGGTIEQMTTLTGWQPHTVRGTISGVLRKRLGLHVACVAPEGEGTRVYRIVLPSGA